MAQRTRAADWICPMVRNSSRRSRNLSGVRPLRLAAGLGGHGMQSVSKETSQQPRVRLSIGRSDPRRPTTVRRAEVRHIDAEGVPGVQAGAARGLLAASPAPTDSTISSGPNLIQQGPISVPAVVAKSRWQRRAVQTTGPALLPVVATRHIRGALRRDSGLRVSHALRQTSQEREGNKL